MTCCEVATTEVRGAVGGLCLTMGVIGAVVLLLRGVTAWLRGTGTATGANAMGKVNVGAFRPKNVHII